MSNDWNQPPDIFSEAKPQEQQQQQAPPTGHVQYKSEDYDDGMDSFESTKPEFPTWILWIGALLLFNGLSYVFGWGWFIY